MKEIIKVCKKLNKKNMLASADGNVSFRVSDDEILITPTGINKASMEESDLAAITLENKILRGNPSGERLMHLEVFKRCPAAKAVVHAHPPYAIAWSIAFPFLKELPSGAMSELILAVGRIPIVPYQRPGTLSMGTALGPFLPQCRVLILAHHGALSWGETLEEAYNGMERLEHAAQILKLATDLCGGLDKLKSLPDHEIAALQEMRKTLGEKTL